MKSRKKSIMNHNILKFAASKSIEDIAADWLVKMDGDITLNEVERKEFTVWINSDPSHRQEFLSLAQIWDDAPVEQIHQLLSTHKTIEQTQTSTWRQRMLSPAYALCSVFFVIAMFLGFSGEKTNEYLTNGIYVTNIGQQQQYQLDDGSSIFLNTDSRVQVEYNDQTRNVWLIYGEAHFDVAKNPNKPFRVYAAGGRVQAVGTAFNVRLTDNLLDVLVTEGRIALSAAIEEFVVTPFTLPKTENDASQMNSILSEVGTLDAGQRIELNAIFEGPSNLKQVANNIETLSESELARRQSWRSGILVFDGQSMSDFVNEVSRFTHATFVINDPQVANIKVGGRYKIDKLDQVLIALEETFNIHVSQLSNSKYLLSKKAESKP